MTAGQPAPPPAPAQAPARAHGHHRATPWPEARALAARAGSAARAAGERPAVRVPLGQALGRTLAEPLRALTDLPSFDSSAMDGWAVAGPGPWTVREEAVLAGHAGAAALAPGQAVRIATGARVPAGTTAVIRAEHSRTEDAHGGHSGTGPAHGEDPRTEDAGGADPRTAPEAGTVLLYPLREVVTGQDIRPRGQECRAGDELLSAGSPVGPAVLGLAAAAGYDELAVAPRPRVEVLVLGDELLTAGLPHDGLIRDALGPMLGPWLTALGAEVLATRRIGDDAEALYTAVTTSAADLVVTTGGTAAGPVDHVHPVLDKAGATLLVDGVKVRPGHPMLLARLDAGRHLVGLPGNPLAAVSGLLTLAAPLLAALATPPRESPAAAPYEPPADAAPGGSPTAAAPGDSRAPLRDPVQGHPYDTRLVPVVHRDGLVVPLRYQGPAMLRGIAAADAMAVVPPGGAEPGQRLELLALPWPTEPPFAQGACFT
ncbi:molybdopterin molybdotransferase MoeA [Streptomyces roseolus]|uniref:molybdopterin molybdotransferase MoeA n=1 Tax=Streptomyces roseolus TaxID=67358 RepID=UPI0016749367|nr:molybdopterin molybdotransferase MoeA [Streptomyces roseolus]GGR14596.1 molybdopterin molybdenumtransferase MoeA [Streptomyces roseolus]